MNTQTTTQLSDYGGGGVTRCSRCQACAVYQVIYQYGTHRVNEKLCHLHSAEIKTNWIIKRRTITPMMA